MKNVGYIVYVLAECEVVTSLQPNVDRIAVEADGHGTVIFVVISIFCR